MSLVNNRLCQFSPLHDPALYDSYPNKRMSALSGYHVDSSFCGLVLKALAHLYPPAGSTTHCSGVKAISPLKQRATSSLMDHRPLRLHLTFENTTSFPSAYEPIILEYQHNSFPRKGIILCHNLVRTGLRMSLLRRDEVKQRIVCENQLADQA